MICLTNWAGCLLNRGDKPIIIEVKKMGVPAWLYAVQALFVLDECPPKSEEENWTIFSKNEQMDIKVKISELHFWLKIDIVNIVGNSP